MAAPNTTHTADTDQALADVDAFMAKQEFTKNGRYADIPHPETGEILSWQRTSTLVETNSDRRALETWEQYSLIQGFAAKPDLVEDAQKAGDDRDKLAAVKDLAMRASGAYAKRDWGTRVHALTEDIDRGLITVDQVPAECRPTIERYLACKATHRFEIVPGWIERVVVNVRFDVAGTVDRLVTAPGFDHPLVLDIKTGSGTVTHGQLEVATQLGVYSSAEWWWDGELHPMPEIEHDVALVLHLPAEVAA